MIPTNVENKECLISQKNFKHASQAKSQGRLYAIVGACLTSVASVAYCIFRYHDLLQLKSENFVKNDGLPDAVKNNIKYNGTNSSLNGSSLIDLPALNTNNTWLNHTNSSLIDCTSLKNYGIIARPFPLANESCVGWPSGSATTSQGSSMDLPALNTNNTLLNHTNLIKKSDEKINKIKNCSEYTLLEFVRSVIESEPYILHYGELGLRDIAIVTAYEKAIYKFIFPMRSAIRSRRVRCLASIPLNVAYNLGLFIGMIDWALTVIHFGRTAQFNLKVCSGQIPDSESGKPLPTLTDFYKYLINNLFGVKIQAQD